MPRGAGLAGKVEAEHRPVPTVPPGVGREGGRGDVGVREREFVCVCAHVCVSGREADFRARICDRGAGGAGTS